MSTQPVTVEKNVPLPTLRRRTSAYKEALQRMDIGDSFVAPQNASQAIRENAKNLSIEVTTRTIAEKQIRVWRTK